MKRAAIVVPDVPAVVNPRRADWSEWSEDHERQRLDHEAAEVTARLATPIYPREQAAQLAADLARQLVPDWRLFRDEHRGAVARIVREQPELQQRDVRQRDKLLNAIFSSLPPHLHPTLSDLRVLWEQLIIAHEAAAFLIGIETGRVMARQRQDERGRIRTGRKPPRQPAGNRLTLANE